MMRVVVISNDVVPDQGGLVAAPGLRAHGLAVGLRAHGCDVSIVVVAEAVARYRAAVGEVGEAPGVEVVAGGDLMAHLRSRRPAAAVMINGNQAEHLEESEGIRYVYDGFAPRMLELAFRTGGPTERSVARLAVLEERAMRLADAVIVNGERKVSWYLAWLLQAGRDLRTVPVRVVEMAVPAPAPVERSATVPMTAAITGYRHDWATLPAGMEAVAGRAGGRFRLVLVEGRHWGTARREISDPRREALAAEQGVVVRPPMPWREFGRFLGEVDLLIDLFGRSPERELAMVTRSMVALGHGIPVIHPPFTEVSPIIAASGAGWLVDPDDPDAVGELLSSLDPAEVGARRAAAARLAVGRLEPANASAPLAEIIEGFE
jgi:hypothetical protein